MALNARLTKRIQALRQEYDALRPRKNALLILLEEAEIAESVYNSNAIENSTLTLKETENILLERELTRNVSLREVYEAKNLAHVTAHIRTKAEAMEVDRETILSLHEMLLTGIEEKIAGRFRKAGEYVRVGTHIAPSPELVERMMRNLLLGYAGNLQESVLDNIAKFHLEFETIHPFNDSNGRIGRALMNWQLVRNGFPPVIIRNKEKQRYYNALREYQETKQTKFMERILALAVLESLHKRIAYLRGIKIIRLSDYVRAHKKHAPAVFNAARRQTIPAFREKGVWMIGEKC